MDEEVFYTWEEAREYCYKNCLWIWCIETTINKRGQRLYIVNEQKGEH